MAKIKTLKDYNNETIYPQSTTKAIVDANGINLDTLHSKFVMMDQITEIEDIDGEYESTLNKVTIIDSTVTDTQYPSAKAVYDAIIINKTEIDLSEYAKITEISANEEDPTVPDYVKNITEENISTWNNKSDFSGSYNDLSDIPTIPTTTSELTNDSNFVSSTDITSIKLVTEYPTTEETGVLYIRISAS